MKKIQNPELEIIQGGKLSPKTSEWLEGFCLGISIGSFLITGISVPLRAAFGLGAIGVACDL